MPIVDVWMQHPTPHFLQQPFFDSLKKWTNQGAVTDVPLEFTVGSMQQGKVSLGLISSWVGPQGALISNDEVAGFVDRFPGQLAGLASVDLCKPMSAVRELRRCVKELGFKGLRIVPWLWGLPPDDRRYYPLYAECVELDIPFCTQIGHTGPLLTSETGRPIPYLEHVALDFPELKIVAGHLGAPWVAETISMMHKFPNFYVDTSAYKIRRFPKEFTEYLVQSEAKKVLFGTNYPMITHADCLKGVENLGLSDMGMQNFLYSNAVKVFGLDLEA